VGEYDQLRVDAVLVGLRSGQGEHQAVVVLGDLADGQREQLAAAQRGEVAVS
jgi:hypothetical protein